MSDLMGLISGLMSPVNTLRSGAEAELGRLKQNHGRDLLTGLVFLVCDETLARQAGTEWARTLGVILLKGITQRESHLWKQLSAEEFHVARSQLLALLVREPPLSRVGRLLIITLAALAKVSPWDELMACVGQYAVSDNEKEKFISFSLLDKLAEYVGSYLTEHLSSVSSFICRSLSEIDHIDIRNQDPTTLAEKLPTMAAAAQACCSVIYEMDEAALTSHQLCLHLVQAAKVGRALVDGLVEAGLDLHMDASGLAEEVFTSLNRLAQDCPRAFQQVYPVIASEITTPICININTGGDGDRYNLVGVKTQCLEMGTSLLTDPITLKEGLFQDAMSQLSSQHLQIVAHLATAVDLSLYGGSEEEAVNEFFSTDISGSTSIFSEETSEEDQDDNLACLALASLEAMAVVFPPQELVQSVLLPVWGSSYMESPQWQARRAVVLLAGVLSEGAAPVLMPLLPELLTKTLILANDVHPRVRYTAVRCLVSFIKHLGGAQAAAYMDTDDNRATTGSSSSSSSSSNEEVGGENAFRTACNAVLPSALCAVIEQNQSYLRIVHAAMHACRLYYDSDLCSPALCEQGDVDTSDPHQEGRGTKVVYFLFRHCHSILRGHSEYTSSKKNGTGGAGGEGKPLFLVEEAASLLGNLYGSFFGWNLRQTIDCAVAAGGGAGGDEGYSLRVRRTLEELEQSVWLFRDIVGPLDGSDNSDGAGNEVGQDTRLPSQESLGTSTLRCRCLESIALVGVSVGRELFRSTALEVLDDLSLAMQRGLDYSDPLSSYICQTAVRLAGLMREEFEPYVTVTVPTIISFIEAEDDVHISLADDEAGLGNPGSTSSSEESSKAKTDTIYRRGQGMVKVTHNPHQVREKLMACRVLYQYICDIPMFLGPYAARAVRALSGLTTSLVFDEEGALVVGTAVSDLVRMYAEEREQRGMELDDNAYALMDLVERLLEELSDAEEEEEGDGDGGGGFGGDVDVLENLANGINTLALLVV